MRQWGWGLWVAVLLASGCSQASSARGGRLLVLWTEASSATPSFDVRLFNKGNGPIHVSRILVEQSDRTISSEVSHDGPHTLLPGGECSVRVNLNGQVDVNGRVLVVESDSVSERVMRLPLDPGA